MLVIDCIRPCFVDVIVNVEAGSVMVTGTVVVTTPPDVLGVEPDTMVMTDTRPVDRLTTVAAGVDVMIVVTLIFGLPDEVEVIVDALGSIEDTVYVLAGPVGPVTMVRVTIVTPGKSVCGFDKVVKMTGRVEGAALGLAGIVMVMTLL